MIGTRPGWSATYSRTCGVRTPVSTGTFICAMKSITQSSHAFCSPLLLPKWCSTRPGETPARAAISRTLASKPRSPKTSIAACRIRAAGVRSDAIELTFNTLGA